MDNEIEATQENLNEAFGKLVKAATEFLSFLFKKSGIRGYDNAVQLVSFCAGQDKLRSMFLGEYITPTEEDPEGEIILHVDAILNLSEYLGIDFYSALAKVFFCQCHCVLSWKSKKKFNFIKAEEFSNKVFRRLAKQCIEADSRMKVYIKPDDKLNMVVRQNWIVKWTGMPLEECLTKIETSYGENAKVCQACYEEPAVAGESMCQHCKDADADPLDKESIEDIIDAIE